MYTRILIVLVIVGFTIEDTLLGPIQKCVATTFNRGQCHECMCSILGGIFACSQIPKCTVRPGDNATLSSNNLLEIKEGQTCVPGKGYKMECNRCTCTKDKSLMCTKMACGNWLQQLKLKEIRDKMKNKKLPPPPTGPCRPGKLYKKGCARCFCDYNKQLKCSDNKNDACGIERTGKASPIMEPEDIRPPFEDSELQNVTTLSSTVNKCIPGKTFQVDCNYCVCMENHNLLCDKMLCLSFDDMNRVAAIAAKGKPCKTDNDIKPNNTCVTCKCINDLSKCLYQPGCVDGRHQQKLALGKSGPKIKIDGTKESCLSGGVYKQDCNRCYCQPDGTLRCTQKTCITYPQAKALRKQRRYLEKHGL